MGAIVQELLIEVGATHQVVVDRVSFRIPPATILGLIGESGSGKSSTGLAVLGYAKRGLRIAGGEVTISRQEILHRSDSSLQDLRGRVVSFIPQDPTASLNPSLRIGSQLYELFAAHRTGLTRDAQRHEVASILSDVGVPQWAVERFPHELSGGQQQRVCIAMAFLLRPQVIVFDEPTTGLDVITQSRILKMIRDLCEAHDTAGLYISHDIAVVAQIADEVAVMQDGTIVESGTLQEILTRPQHPYSQALIAAVPKIDFSIESPWMSSPEPCNPSSPVLEVSHVSAGYGRRSIVSDITFGATRGEIVAIVGESGSGKTTLIKAIAGTASLLQGEVFLHGQVLPIGLAHRTKEQRRAVQYVFQNPYSALNPRMSVDEILAVPLRAFFNLSNEAIRERILQALVRVGLTHDKFSRFPDELSGGERQRVAIARALLCEPTVLLCDEITSSLDVVTQASIVHLLNEISRDTGLSIVFVTHNLALVSQLANHVVVFLNGRQVESGPTGSVLTRPKSDYVKDLLRAAPTLIH